MSKTAYTVRIWSFYLIGLSLTLLLVPNLLLSLFAIPATSEVWIRIVGMLLLILAYYCYEASRLEVTQFFRWSVNARATVIFFFTAFVLLKLAPPQLILFGAVDLVGALWTRAALRS
ncbi:MAG: hypothetical protein KDE56_19150 [Anaerolineales bacterium]|nr:hypothetical protein [Anaerolineales bacterium]